MSVFQFLDRNFIQANIFSEHDILTSIPVLPIADDSGLRSIDYQVQTVADVTLIRFGKGIGLRLADITGQHPPVVLLAGPVFVHFAICQAESGKSVADDQWQYTLCNL